jgi:Zn-dependent M32 family carboxypeptidase
MGAAKDIVEWDRRAALPVQRLPARQFSRASRTSPTRNASRSTCAIKVLESAIGPRTTVQSPLRWNDDGDWKNDYNNVARMPAEEVASAAPKTTRSSRPRWSSARRRCGLMLPRPSPRVRSTRGLLSQERLA